MGRIFDAVDGALEWISSWGIRLSCFFLALMFALTNVEVIGRYVVGYSTLIAEEYVSYFLVWMTFLGYAATCRGGHFIRVQLVLDKVSPRFRDILQSLAAFVSCVLCVVLTYCVADTTLLSYRFKSISLQVSQTPLVIPQAIMPVAMGVLAVVFLGEAIRRLRLAMGFAVPTRGVGGAP
jgi:TRAP-type C4-dicarboxylate transport system permease small subunit